MARKAGYITKPLSINTFCVTLKQQILGARPNNKKAGRHHEISTGLDYTVKIELLCWNSVYDDCVRNCC